MNDHHETILETYFWAFVDKGDALGTTPLFTGIYQSERLASIISRQFQLSKNEAESAIELARNEVEL